MGGVCSGAIAVVQNKALGVVMLREVRLRGMAAGLEGKLLTLLPIMARYFGVF